MSLVTKNLDLQFKAYDMYFCWKCQPVILVPKKYPEKTCQKCYHNYCPFCTTRFYSEETKKCFDCSGICNKPIMF